MVVKKRKLTNLDGEALIYNCCGCLGHQRHGHGLIHNVEVPRLILRLQPLWWKAGVKDCNQGTVLMALHRRQRCPYHSVISEGEWLLFHEINASQTSPSHLLPRVHSSGQAGSQGNTCKGSLTDIWYLKRLSPGTFWLCCMCFQHSKHLASYFIESQKLELGELSAVSLKSTLPALFSVFFKSYPMNSVIREKRCFHL